MKKEHRFGHISTKAAKQAAMDDMKKEKMNASIVYLQHLVLNQPVITYRCGLFGF